MLSLSQSRILDGLIVGVGGGWWSHSIPLLTAGLHESGRSSSEDVGCFYQDDLKSWMGQPETIDNYSLRLISCFLIKACLFYIFLGSFKVSALYKYLVIFSCSLVHQVKNKNVKGKYRSVLV